MVVTPGVGTLSLGKGANSTGILNIHDGDDPRFRDDRGGGTGSYLIEQTWVGEAQVNLLNTQNYVLDKQLSGQLKLQQKGTGTTTLTKNSAFSGQINVEKAPWSSNSTITEAAPITPPDVVENPGTDNKITREPVVYPTSLDINVGVDGTLTGSSSIDGTTTRLLAGTLAPGNGSWPHRYLAGDSVSRTRPRSSQGKNSEGFVRGLLR